MIDQTPEAEPSFRTQVERLPQIDLRVQHDIESIDTVTYDRKYDRTQAARTLALAVLATAASMPGAAVAQDSAPEGTANPNQITYQESLACVSRTLNSSNVVSTRPTIPQIKRGKKFTKGPITIKSTLNLDDTCVENSQSMNSRYHGVLVRTVTPVYRIKEKGSQKYKDWSFVSPDIMSPDNTSPSKEPTQAVAATHNKNLKTSPDGMRTIGSISSRFMLPRKFRPGDRVQAGIYIKAYGLIEYDTGRRDPLSPDVPVTIRAGSYKIFEGGSVAVKKPKKTTSQR